MRLQAVFVFLLIVTATASSLALRNLAPAREGAVMAQMVAFAGAAVALAGCVLLARIVIRVRASDGRGKG